MVALESLGLFGLFIGSFLAATVLPFSTDVLYMAVLALTKDTVGCFVYATLGNWIGGITTYYVGRIGRWEWIEKWFKVKHSTLEKHKERVDKYGVWLALLSWVPIFGDVAVLALGFYKAKPLWTIIFLLVGKAARFLVWNMIWGHL
ncbi:MAG: DedA family protein [Bacteroidales bacterium]|nr:DedA family protein [Bacteroidales bacterium]